MPLLKDAKAIYAGSAKATKVYLGSTAVWSSMPIPATGMGLWLKADNVPNAVNGQSISKWPDSGPHGFHADANAAGTGPTYHTEARNGLPAVTFGGPYMDSRGAGTWLSGRSEWSLVAALGNTSFTNYPIMVAAPTSTVWQWIIEFDVTGNGSSGTTYLGVGNGYYRNMLAGLQPGWISMSVSKAIGVAPRLWISGTEITGVNYLGPSGDALETVPDVGADIRIGAYFNGNYPLQADLGEIVMYDHALTDADRQQVESYLRTKWGL